MSSESIQQRESEEVGNGRRGALSRLALARMRFLIYDKGTRKKWQNSKNKQQGIADKRFPFSSSSSSFFAPFGTW